jgi:Branched-chain amino acid transport system / permease component/ABC transporter
VWLCQITFAGIGAVATAELASRHGWPVLAGVAAGGLLCAAVGAVIGLATSRLGDLHVALVTLSFGLLVDNLVFRLGSIYNYGAGIPVSPPAFAATSATLSWLALSVFCVLALIVATLRRSTFGFAVSAVRWSEPGARTTGLSIASTKAGISALAAAAAGIGGGLLAIYTGAAVPGSFATFSGLIWLAAPSRAAALDRAFSLFPVLDKRRGQQAGSLSGGEQQMLSLARALAVDTRLLVVDEPSLRLAPKLVDMVFETLETAKRSGLTLIVIEQSAHKALAIADRCVILRRRAISWEGTASGARAHLTANYFGTDRSRWGNGSCPEPRD